MLGVPWNRVQTKCEAIIKTLTGFCVPLLHAVPQVRLKPPMAMDTNLCMHECEANQNTITMPGLKLRLQVMFWAPKWPQNIKFSWGSMPPDPPLLCVLTHALEYISTCKPAMQFCFRGLSKRANPISIRITTNLAPK